MYVVVFNRHSMEVAKREYEKFPRSYNHRKRYADLSHVIDEAIAEAKDYGDKFTPKIFIVKD